MKEAVVDKGPTVRIRDVPIPEPKADEVLIKVVFSGSNPKDWKVADWIPDKENINQGDDIAGVVHKVGSDVTEFKPGDRVAAFHEMMSPGGSYAEYAIAHAHTTWHIPRSTSFEAAAAVPLAALTAGVGLFVRLGLPEPWRPATEPTPLVVYGAASAVGAYVVQLARRANIHPLICVAGKSQAHVEALIDRSRGDTIIDYRAGDAAVVDGIRTALAPAGRPLRHAYDAVSDNGSYVNLCQVLEPGASKIALVLPLKKYEEIPESIEKCLTQVGSVHAEDKDFGHIFCRYLARAMADGWFKPQPQEVVPGGLAGVQKGLENLKAGRANAVKYVFRIADTPGVAGEKL